ncbi:hypothetical protein OAX78_04095 [Planctomycetota bacterium]|nr:hypothetical protein [Planctomycetota bacterium]
MTPGAVTCSKCNTPMETGFVPTSKGGVSLFSAAWHPGPPDSDKSFWEKFATGPGVKVDPEKLIPICACRCPSCGIVELHSPT